MADEVEIKVSTSGTKEAEKQLKDLSEAAQQASQSAEEIAESVAGVQASGDGALQFLDAFSAAMKGDLVGAAKMAGQAIKSLGLAFATQPVLASIAVIAAAVAGLTKMFVETRHALEELYTVASTGQAAAIGRILERKKLDFGAIGDERLDNVISSLENARDNQRRKVEEAEDEMSAIQSAPAENLSYWQTRKRKARIEDLNDSAARHYEQEKQYQAQLDAAIAERERRRKAEDKSQSDAKSQGQSLADSEIALRHKQERYEAYDKAEAEKPGSGRLAALEKELFQVKAMHSIAEEGTQKEIDLRDKILDIEHNITEEKRRQKKEEEEASKKAEEKAKKEEADTKKKVEAEKKTHAEWQRSRKLDGMKNAEDRVSYINNEIGKLRQQPATIENRERMRKLIDERDSAKKDADAFKEKKQDFLHRNDSDAQRLASIGKQLEAAGATGDQAQMLELMMAGEDIAENYQEPQTKRQQRRAARKAERDAKAAMREARAFRKQVAGVEAAWNAGDKSAAEAVAGMHTDAQGNTYAVKMNDNGKMVKVEGQDLTNDLLEQIKKALA